ncbi:Hypothetical Protein FCC1311_117982 [Hondaea fermentalgiana]|uniref:Uncharacterized protein n=1 Tax=Hondaea fermentalgiana TaxID=2315210 RepID=A0A2R5FJD3_9STRA|nr:Hypothetical Protein FCC1311_117982 [Hondaea fermentalgiana]|eukprot:GBG16323.1 Hypothetical Protein FCC1311_117982 [Hondaea fermentalgiana]
MFVRKLVQRSCHAVEPVDHFADANPLQVRLENFHDVLGQVGPENGPLANVEDVRKSIKVLIPQRGPRDYHPSPQVRFTCH